MPRLSDVWAHRDRLVGRILLPDIADELDMPYHEAYQPSAASASPSSSTPPAASTTSPPTQQPPYEPSTSASRRCTNDP